MARVTFTANLERHLSAAPIEAPGSTVREVLEAAFGENSKMRGYVLDDQGRLRRHVVLFVDGKQVADRDGLGDAIGPAGELLVMQALSGG